MYNTSICIFSILSFADVFIPSPENLIVNLHEQYELIKDLLEQIPEKYQESFDTNCALGAALEAAYKLMVRREC